MRCPTPAVVGGLFGLFLLFFFVSMLRPAPATPRTPADVLAPPVALAAPLQQATSPFAGDAGIAAYFQIPAGIDINADIQALYRTIETDIGLDYIIGTVPVPGYDDQHDIHLYLDTNGWVVAFYPDESPTSKVIDWIAWDATSLDLPTKLESAVVAISPTLSPGNFALNYYHFQYPAANRMTLVAEQIERPFNTSAAASDSFTVTLPTEFTYYETSWVLASRNTGFNGSQTTQNTYQLNGATIAQQENLEADGIEWNFTSAVFAADQITAGVPAVVEISITAPSTRDGEQEAYAGLAVIYEEP